MQDTTEINEPRWLTFGELATEMIGIRRMDETRMKELLEGPLNKIRGNLFERGLVTEKAGSEKHYLYHSSLVVPIVAYVKWHQPGTRHSMANAIGFVDKFMAGEKAALNYLPPKARAFMMQEVNNGEAQVLHLKRTA